jgi:hypothetical protein
MRNYRPKTQTVNFIFMQGGLGDAVAALPVLKYVQNKYTWITPLIWMPDFMVDFSKELLPEMQIKGYSDMKKHYDQRKPTKTTQWDGIVSPMKIHCTDYAFLKLCDEIPSIEEKNFLQLDPDNSYGLQTELPKDYIVLTTGFTAEVREFPAATVNAIAQWCADNSIEVVWLGKKATGTGGSYVIKGAFNQQIDYTKGLDLIDKTTLLQAAYVMGKAKAVLGVDNGLLHVAGCTDTNIIGGFTTVSPEIRIPVRNNELAYKYYTVTPEPELGCRFCQQKTNFLYNHDYKFCMYNDKLCVSDMTAEKFITILKKLV